MSDEATKDTKTRPPDAAPEAARPAASSGDAGTERGGAVAPANDAKDPGRDGHSDKDGKQEKDEKKEGDEKKGKSEKKDKNEKKDKDKNKEKDKKQDRDGKPAEEGKEARSPRPPFRLPEPALLAGIVVVALGVGAVLGSLVIAPRVVAARNAHAVARAQQQAQAGQEGGEAAEPADEKHGGKKHEKDKPALFQIDNVVANPAGSAGTRFLMASVVLELPDEKAVLTLRDREAEVRDVVLATFESETLEQLTTPGAREDIKRKLRIAILPLCPGVRKMRVYLPTFVVQ